MDADQLIADYGAAVDARRAAAFVGSGLSLPAGYPSWADLLEPARLRRGLAEGYDLVRLAQFEVNDGRRSELVASICEQVASVVPEPTENHRLLDQLPLEEVWTTNYDTLIEAAMGDAHAVVVDEDFLRLEAGRRVYKMHGSIPPGAVEPVGGENELVISADDFDDYESNHPRFWQLLQAQMLTRSFLFVGFSLRDPNAEKTLLLLRRAQQTRPIPHFALLKGGAADFEATARDFQRAGVNVVTIDDYDEITDVLRRLVARTRPSRLLISGSPPADRPPAENPTDRYPTAEALPEDLLELAGRLGTGLASADVRVVAGGEVGAAVGYALMDAAIGYDPDRFVLLRRQKPEPVDPPNQRRGTIRFTGEQPSDLRDAAFAEVRALVVLGGGRGTANEIGRARNLGMGIVPVAVTAGTARQVWEEMTANLAAHRLGDQPIDTDLFAALADPQRAVDAAVTLCRQALYLPTQPTS